MEQHENPVTCTSITEGLVVLFRVPKEGSEDLFEQELQMHGFTVCSIPVLEFIFVNISKLADQLRTGSDNFSAVIFTSKRAVQAATLALQQITDDTDVIKCRNMPCYVVGKSTYQEAKAAGFMPVNEEAGNAECLSRVIVNSLGPDSKPLLYPCGNLRQDTLSNKLMAAGFRFTELEVYMTQKAQHIKDHYLSFIQEKGMPEYIVYFSPSGVQSTEDLVTSGLLPLDQVKVVAIGPTTERELHQRSIPVYGVAAKPDPMGVVHALAKKQFPSNARTELYSLK